MLLRCGDCTRHSGLFTIKKIKRMHKSHPGLQAFLFSKVLMLAGVFFSHSDVELMKFGH